MNDIDKIKELNSLGLSWQEIADHIGYTKAKVRGIAKKHGLSSNFRHSNIKTLRAIERNGFILVDRPENIKTSSLHSFICPVCKKVFKAIPSNLRRESVSSCGCASLGRRRGGKYVTGQYLSTLKHRYKKRNLSFTISINYIEKLLARQNFQCALSGLDLECDGWKGNFTASLDRIDSSKGYVEGNVQWVHKDVNLMKNHFPQQYFLNICFLITENNKGNE